MGYHGMQPQFLASALGQGGTDKPTAMGGHKIDGLRADEFRGSHKVSFVFAVLVIHDNYDLSLSNVLNGILNGMQLCLFVLGQHHGSISFFLFLKFKIHLIRSIKWPNPTNPLSAVALLVSE